MIEPSQNLVRKTTQMKQRERETDRQTKRERERERERERGTRNFTEKYGGFDRTISEPGRFYRWLLEDSED
jgi:hypothetical protein